MPPAEQLHAQPTMAVTVRDVASESPWGSGPTRPQVRRVLICALCPTCGGRRGEPKGLNQCDDGAHFWTQVWANPCGHVDTYADVIAEFERYVELDPAGAHPAGNVGSDYQVGESWRRRFARRLHDEREPWAVVEVTFHIAEDASRDPAELIQTTAYRTCTDVRDPHGTKVWLHSKSRVVPTGSEPAQDMAKQACDAFDPADLAWDGPPF